MPAPNSSNAHGGVDDADFRPGLPAAAVHEALKGALRALQRAERCAVLWFAEVHRRGLYRELGYSSMHQYAADALGFSQSRTYQFLRLAEALAKLPHLRRSVATGEIGWTKARAVARVATPQSEGAWIQVANQQTRVELERRIAEARAAARGKQPPPRDAAAAAEASSAPEAMVNLTLRLTPVQYARYEALVERIWKRGAVARGASREDVLLAALDELARAGETLVNSGTDTARERGCTRVQNESHYQIVVQQCPSCGRAEIETPAGRRALAPATIATIACDARVLGVEADVGDGGSGGGGDPQPRNLSTIPPAVRRAVLVRDGHRCQAPGCGRRRFLEVHHRVPRAKGGTNRRENLITLCAACHRLRHEPALAAASVQP